MLEDLIKERRATRKYLAKQIPDEDLAKIMQAAYLAPSWMNSQPWKFILVKNPETKALLSELAGFQPHVKNAPAVIACVADKSAWNKDVFGEVLKARGMTGAGIEKVLSVPLIYPVLLGNERVLLRSIEQVTYAISFMMLQAQELNVSSCVIGAIYNEATVQDSELQEKVSKALNLSKDDVLCSLLVLGYSAEDKTPKIRKDFNKIIHLEKVGNPLGAL